MLKVIQKINRCLLLLALSAVLLGCSQTLYEDLSESEANDVTATLRMEDIDASKISMKDKKWGVSVPPGDFARAVVILRDRNLPVFGYEGLGKTFRKDSLLVTPTEERARLMHALSEELTLTLRQIEGVLDARVHVVIPPRDVLSDSNKASSASIFLKTRPGVDLTSQMGSIKALVVNSVEGVTVDSVSVMAVASAGGAPTEVKTPTSLMRTVSIGLLVLAALIAVVWLLFMSKPSASLRENIKQRWVAAKGAQKKSAEEK
jgi:type III secretion protein J